MRFPRAGIVFSGKELCRRLPCRLVRLPGKKASDGQFSVEIKCQNRYSVFIVLSIFLINLKDRRCLSPRRRVKRETGENPVRTRHCKWGIEGGIVTGRKRPGRQLKRDDPQARKPACSPGICRTTRNWPGRMELLCRKRLYGFVRHAFPRGKAFFCLSGDAHADPLPAVFVFQEVSYDDDPKTVCSR